MLYVGISQGSWHGGQVQELEMFIIEVIDKL